MSYLPVTHPYFCFRMIEGGWVRQRCRVSCVIRASNWYWLTGGQGLLSLQQVRVEGGMFFISSVSSLSFVFLFLPCPSLSCLLSHLSLFSLSLEDDTKWPTRVDVSLNPNTINQFPDDNLSKYESIFTKLGMCIDIMEIWFANGQIWSFFDRVICSLHDRGRILSFHFFFLFFFFYIAWFLPVSVRWETGPGSRVTTWHWSCR